MTGSGGVPQDVHVDVAAFVGTVTARRGAVDMETAAACQELSWAAMGRGDRPGEPGQLARPGRGVLAWWAAVRGGVHGPALTAAYDELIGLGRWRQARISGRRSSCVPRRA